MSKEYKYQPGDRELGEAALNLWSSIIEAEELALKGKPLGDISLRIENAIIEVEELKMPIPKLHEEI